MALGDALKGFIHLTDNKAPGYGASGLNGGLPGKLRNSNVVFSSDKGGTPASANQKNYSSKSLMKGANLMVRSDPNSTRVEALLPSDLYYAVKKKPNQGGNEGNLGETSTGKSPKAGATASKLRLDKSPPPSDVPNEAVSGAGAPLSPRTIRAELNNTDGSSISPTPPQIQQVLNQINVALPEDSNIHMMMRNFNCKSWQRQLGRIWTPTKARMIDGMQAVLYPGDDSTFTKSNG